MAFLTEAAARTAFAQGPISKGVAESELRKMAGRSASLTYDIFLSHSFLDAELILGLKRLLESHEVTVYVDWIDDPQADRSNVTVETAKMLRERMRNCRALVYATSSTSNRSKWMPWELGYFDGFRPGHVGVLPLVRQQGERFVGQEYLGLYPLIEVLDFQLGGQEFGILKSETEGTRIKSFVA